MPFTENVQSLVFIYIIFNSQRKRIKKKNLEFAAQVHTTRFFLVPTGSRCLGEMKTSTNDDN